MHGIAAMRGYPAVLVGADEVAVDSFLKGKIGFADIWGLVEKVLSNFDGNEPENLDEAVSLVDWGRREAVRLSG